MAPQIKNVMVLGAGGRVGSVFLPIFLESGLNISVLSRPESTSSFPAQANVVRANYEPEELKKAFTGQDAVVSLVGHEALHQQEVVLDAAVAAGVKWFVPSEFGNDTSNPEAIKDIKMFNSKVMAAKYLMSKEKDGLSWTAFITNAFFDMGMKHGILGFDLANHTARIWDDGDTVFTTITLPTIAKAVVNLLSSPENLDAAKNRYAYISSFATTQNDIQAALEKVTGHTFTVRERVDGAKAEQAARKAADSGEMMAMLDQILAMLLKKGSTLGDNSAKAAKDNALLLPGNHQTVEDELRKIVESLKQ